MCALTIHKQHLKKKVISATDNYFNEKDSIERTKNLHNSANKLNRN